MGYRYKIEEVKEIVEKYGYILFSNYKNTKTQMIFGDCNRYLYWATFDEFRSRIIYLNQKFRMADLGNPFSIENIKVWLLENNNNIEFISDKYTGSHIKHWFYCKICLKDFDMSWNSINRGQNCPYCAKNGKRVSERNSFYINYPELVKEWDYNKNKNVDIENLQFGSDIKLWWICKKCGYEFFVSPNTRTNRNSGCPACAGKVVTEKNSFVILYPKIAKEWDYNKNGNLIPNDFSYGSHVKVWWICPVCGYSYVSRILSRSHGSGCAACAGKVVSDLNRLSILFPEIAAEWDYNKNEGKPENFSFGSAKRAWWICSICKHSYELQVYNRVWNKGCPICNSSGGEQRIAAFLKNNDIKFKKNYWFKDLITNLNWYLFYDFAILNNDKSLNTLVEYDGRQHFINLPFFYKTEEDFNRRKLLDKMKDDYAKNNNIPFFRINYKQRNIEEVLRNYLSIGKEVY